MKRPLFSLLSLATCLIGLTFLTPALQAAPLPDDLKTLFDRAQEHQNKAQWREACRIYDEILKKDHGNPDARDKFQICLRHVLQSRRHGDETFRRMLLNLKPIPAADIYEEILVELRKNFLDRDAVEITKLFQQGLEELGFALADDLFLKDHLPNARREAIEAFRARFPEWREKKFSTPRAARDQVLEVALIAKRHLGLEQVVAIFEFACGACNGLDENTFYLTPGQLTEAYATIKGEHVGIGVQLEVVDGKLFVAQVQPESDAAEKRLRPGDRILEIDRRAVDQLSFEEVVTRLQGDPGSKVELVVQGLGEVTPRTLKVQRRAAVVRSVDWEILMEGDSPATRVGLIRLLTFHENTVQEFRDALVQLQTRGATVLILDLRGNPGGLFGPAIQVAELFLSDSVIVLTHSRLRSYNRIFKAENANPVDLPLVVLVDSETASAAEVVAGALKENQRATLVGQTTYGKGSIQRILPLEKAPSGIRVTVAKFYSPANYAYSGRGVTPHDMVDASPEAQLARARLLAQQLAGMMMNR